MAEMFGFDETTSEGTGGKNIVVKEEGDFIQDNCTVTKFELSTDEKYIDVEIENANGKTSNKRIYLPKATSEYTTPEKYKKAVEVFGGALANISRRYKGEAYKASGSTAIEVTKKVITDIKPLLARVPVRVKLELREGPTGGIFTNIASFGPFEDMNKKSAFVINNDQKLLLAKKNAYKPDAETSNADVTTPSTDDIGF